MSKKHTKKVEIAEVKASNNDGYEKDLNTKIPSQCDKIWRWIFMALAALGLITMVIMSTDAGMFVLFKILTISPV